MYYLVCNKQPMKDIDKPPIKRVENEARAIAYAQNLNALRVDVIAVPDNGEAYLYKRYPINK